MNNILQPIFIHSLFRAGSTYLYHCFRRAPSHFTCYQEPDHEIISKLDSDPDYILSMTTSTLELLRHPDIGLPYFQEIYDIRDSLKGLFSEEYSFKEFFPEHPSRLPAHQQAYFSALIELAEKRPVLQLCRSFGRINQLKDTFSGLHIHLWREPRTQWWSYLIDAYFENTINLIAEAEHTPQILKVILQPNLPLGEYSFEQRYKRFFAIWLYSFIENLKHSDLEISIDMLDSDVHYRLVTLDALAKHNIIDINFDDCKSPYTKLSNTEITQYKAIEDGVFELFTQHANTELLNTIKQKLNDIHVQKNIQSDDAVKYRDVAVKLMNSQSNTLFDYHSQVNNALSMYNNELAKVEQTTSKLLQTELTLQQTKADLEQRELQLEHSEENLKQTKLQLQQLEKNLDQINTELQQTLSYLHESENRTALQTIEIEKLSVRLSDTESKLLSANEQIRQILSSYSWKITAPIRWLKQKIFYKYKPNKNSMPQ